MFSDQALVRDTSLLSNQGLVLYDCLCLRGGAEQLTLELVNGLPNTHLGFGFRNQDAFPNHEISHLTFFDLHAASNIPGWRILKVMRAFADRCAFINHYDWVIYSGSYAPLAVHWHPHGKNIYYCHTIPRFAYDLRNYYIDNIPLLLRPLLLKLIENVKRHYEPAIRSMQIVIANSENVRRRLRHYLNREATVIYPPIDTKAFRWQNQGDYYLSLARLEDFKRVDRIVAAFKRMPDKKLVVASGGQQLAKLQKIAADAPNIRFTGWIDEAQLQQLVGNAIATLYIPIDEDFGMSPVESMAAGKPVIGVAEGGLLETVINGETGVLLPENPYPEQIVETVLQMTPERAQSMRTACEARAQLFSKEIFLKRMRALIDDRE
ncbi:MAG: glycosyltransferase [Pseudomonadota bacterium]